MRDVGIIYFISIFQMASELSLQAVRELLLDKGGIVRNKDLVRYFKEFLNNPATKGEQS